MELWESGDLQETGAHQVIVSSTFSLQIPTNHSTLTYLECRTGMEDCLTICAGTTDDELTSLLLPLLMVVLLWFWYNGDLTMVCRLDGAVDASDSVTLTTSELFLR